MRGRAKLISSLVLIGMLLGVSGTAWAEEPLEADGLRGQVTAIGGNTLSVTTRGGEEARVIVHEDARLIIPGASEPTIADIDVGDFVGARGERNEDGDLVAEVLLVVPAEYIRYRNIVHGEVTAVEGSTLTVRTGLGGRLVITDEETGFRIPGVEEPSIVDISVGDLILALGRSVEEGNLLARVVAVVSDSQLRRHSLRGLITGIEGDTLTMATRRGEIQVVTSEETSFRIPGVEDAGIGDLNLRDLVVALGTWDAEEEVFTARAVVLIPRWPSHLRFVRGEVTGIEGQTIVLQAFQGELGVLTDENTIFRIPGVEAPELDDLEVGDKVGVLVAHTEGEPPLAKVVVVRRGPSSLVDEMVAPIEATAALIEAAPWADAELTGR